MILCICALICWIIIVFSLALCCIEKQIKNFHQFSNYCYYAVFLIWYFFIFHTGICFKIPNLCGLTWLLMRKPHKSKIY